MPNARLQNMSQTNTQPMKKHKFNIFPEASPEDFNRLLEDIRNNGFDQSQPITIFEGEILDGWNRWKACDILNIRPAIKNFEGDSAEAIRFMMRTNKRRNLNKGQWACIAAEADELLAKLRAEAEEERKMKQKENAANQHTSALAQKIAPTQSKAERETATKAAELFNTNRTYVNQAVKMRTEAPEVFEKVKAGKMTMQDARKEVARKPTDPEWLPDELDRKTMVENGETVVANYQRDKHLIEWASANGKIVPIDRASKWGNPFILGQDGDRDRVCDCYEKHYAPNKDSFAEAADKLKGKVLCCHCYPQKCHGDSLIRLFLGNDQ